MMLKKRDHNEKKEIFFIEYKCLMVSKLCGQWMMRRRKSYFSLVTFFIKPTLYSISLEQQLKTNIINLKFFIMNPSIIFSSQLSLSELSAIRGGTSGPIKVPENIVILPPPEEKNY